MKSSTEATVVVSISRIGFMQALNAMIVQNMNFEGKKWALADAEDMETAAKMIRDAYADNGE